MCVILLLLVYSSCCYHQRRVLTRHQPPSHPTNSTTLHRFLFTFSWALFQRSFVQASSRTSVQRRIGPIKVSHKLIVSLVFMVNKKLNVTKWQMKLKFFYAPPRQVAYTYICVHVVVFAALCCHWMHFTICKQTNKFSVNCKNIPLSSKHLSILAMLLVLF